MVDWSDNGGYLLLGLLAFWLPVVGYGWSLRRRAALLAEEETLLREEIGVSSPQSPIARL